MNGVQLVHLCGAVLLAAALTSASAQQNAQQGAWQGELEVAQHSGLDCGQQPARPYRMAVQASAGPGGIWMVWGAEMEIVRIVPHSQLHQPHVIQSFLSHTQVGRLYMDRDGLWREPDIFPGESGCRFTEAYLRLQPVTDADRRAEIVRLGTWLTRWYEAKDGIIRAGATTVPGSLQRTKAIEAVLDLARQLPAASSADDSVAEELQSAGDSASVFDLVKSAGDNASGLGKDAAALELYQAASTVYRRMAPRDPEGAALGLMGEARLRYRIGGLPAARPVAEEALALLRQRDDTYAEWVVCGTLGLWQLHAGDVHQAEANLSRAARVDEKRDAPEDRRAQSLMNLAMAQEAGGRPTEALQTLRRALPLAEAAGGKGINDAAGRNGIRLAKAIKQRIDALTAAGSGRGT